MRCIDANNVVVHWRGEPVQSKDAREDLNCKPTKLSTQVRVTGNIATHFNADVGQLERDRPDGNDGQLVIPGLLNPGRQHILQEVGCASLPVGAAGIIDLKFARRDFAALQLQCREVGVPFARVDRVDTVFDA